MMWEDRGVPPLGNPWDSEPEVLGTGTRMMQKEKCLQFSALLRIYE